MALELFKLLGTVAVKNEDALNAIDVTNNKAEQLSRNMTRKFAEAGKNFVAVGKQMASIGKTIMVGVTTPTIALGTATAKTSLEFLSLKENTRTAFKVLLGSAEAAQQMLDDLYTFAKTTPFSYGTYLEVGKTLVSMGISAKNVIPYLDGITNAAIATGKGEEAIKSVSGAIGKMTTQTKLSLEGMYMISDQGIPVFKILGNQLGVTTQKLMEMISSGKLASNEMLPKLLEGINNGTDGVNGMTSAFAGLARETKNNLSGLLDSLRSSFRNMSIDIWNAEASYESLKNVVKAFTEVIRNIAPVFKGLGDVAVPVLDNITKKLNTFAEYLKKTDPEKLKKIGNIILKLATAGPILFGIGKAINFVGNMMEKGVTFVEKYGKKFNSTINKASNSVKKWKDDVKTYFTLAGSYIKDGMNQAKTAFKEFEKALKEIGKGVFDIVSIIAKGIGNITKSITSGIKDIVGIVIGSIVDIVKSITYELFGPIIDKINQLKDKIVQHVITLKDKISNKIIEIKDSIINHIISLKDTVLNKLTELKNKMVNLIITIKDNMIAKFTELKNKVINIAITIKDKVIEKINQLKNGSVNLFTKIKDTIIKAISPIVSSVSNKFVQMKDAVVNKLSDLKERVIEKFSPLLNAVKEKVEAIKNIAVERFEVMKVMISNRVEEMANSLKTHFSNMASALSGRIAEMVGKLSGPLRKCTTGRKKSFRSIWQWSRSVRKRIWYSS